MVWLQARPVVTARQYIIKREDMAWSIVMVYSPVVLIELTNLRIHEHGRLNDRSTSLIFDDNSPAVVKLVLVYEYGSLIFLEHP